MRFIHITKLLRRKHWLKGTHKLINRWVFEFVSTVARKKSLEFRCMNYGYAGGEDIHLEEEDSAERYALQMYNKLVSKADVAGKKVLEIGCGRGGGAYFIAKYLKPEQITGLDISKNNMKFCQSAYDYPNLNFVLGDAENLPFVAETFDVVINQESSHAYPHMDKFLEGVNRILKPGGIFCWSDFRYKEDITAMNDLFESKQFKILHEEDLTPGVLKSLDLDSGRKERMISSNFKSPIIRWFLGNFAVVKTSSNFKSYEEGDYKYLWRVMTPVKRNEDISAPVKAEAKRV